MQIKMIWQKVKNGWRAFGILILLMAIGNVGTVAAATSSSTNYSVNETQFGAGSSLNDCSASYCAKTSAGDLTVGEGTSANYRARFGFNTSDVPMLEVIVTGGNQDLGVLDTSTTASLTNLIRVRNYLSNGYVMQISGAPLLIPGHTMTAIPTPSTSSQGAEQFGINLVANTVPNIGANPVQVPSGSYSFGTVTPDYATPDLFKYINGDIIGQSATSTGETDYTLSMIVNISNGTPAGQYKGAYSAVVTATF